MDNLLLAPKTMLNWFADQKTEPTNTLAEDNRAIIEALTNKPLEEPRVKQTFLCRWCLNPVTQVPKSRMEYVPLRAVLMIPDAVADPPICSDCYDARIGSFNRHATNIGTRNDGYTNLALAKLTDGNCK